MNIFWFRRDLRLYDNAALSRALSAGPVLPVFVFDTDILSGLENKHDRRVSFIYHRLKSLKREIEKSGSTLKVLHGRPVDVFGKLLDGHRIEKVYAGRDYEPYAKRRDRAVAKLLQEHGIELVLVKDHVIVEGADLLKKNNTPYVMYTPYMRAWKKRCLPSLPGAYPSAKQLGNLLHREPEELPALQRTGFYETPDDVPEANLAPEQIRRYRANRDFPAHAGTRAGPHLRFGTLSIRGLVAMAADLSETWLNQLIWRDFFIQILDHFPHTAERSFRPAYDGIPWRNDAVEFRRWCEGMTGYPLVDAGMRELNATGYMHNRARMIAANFLCKLLLVDWRWGERYFAEKLLDYEMANNVGGWQWACGSGCDAAPYFRIFNPDTQIRKFDPHLQYVKAWIPELDTAGYPARMVDYRMARERALTTYKKVLANGK